jgi:hypothetical protein
MINRNFEDDVWAGTSPASEPSKFRGIQSKSWSRAITALEVLALVALWSVIFYVFVVQLFTS